jgi:DNA-binding transcriptional LysR family regulator
VADRWDDWELVLAVRRHGSFAAAGKACGVDQSTVSRRLDALEKTLGGALFVRSKRGAHPTELAHRLWPFLESAEEALRDATAEATRASGEPSGPVRVATLELVAEHYIVPALPAFFRKHPKVQVELVPDGRIARLTEREADIGLRFSKPSGGDLVAKRLARLDHGAFASKRYLEGRKLRSTPCSAATLDWIGMGGEQRHYPASEWLETHARHAVRLRVSRPSGMLAAVRSGVGAMLLPRVFAAIFPELHEIELVEPIDLAPDLWLVSHRTLLKSAAVRAVYDFIPTVFTTSP